MFQYWLGTRARFQRYAHTYIYAGVSPNQSRHMHAGINVHLALAQVFVAPTLEAFSLVLQRLAQGSVPT